MLHFESSTMLDIYVHIPENLTKKCHISIILYQED